MADALVVTVSDAIVAGLNAQSFSMSFIATREYVVEKDIEDLSGLNVSVVPVSVTRTQTTRDNRIQYDIGVNIGVQQVVDPYDVETVDPLVYLVEEIRQYIESNAFSSMQLVETITGDIVSDFQMLKSSRVFFNVTDATFRIIRS